MMTPDEIAAERERFAEACPEFPHTKIPVFGDPQFMFSHTRVAERAWMKRAEIAHAREAELRAEIERLRADIQQVRDWRDEAAKTNAGTIASLEAEIRELRAAAAELAEIKRAWGMAAKDL